MVTTTSTVLLAIILLQIASAEQIKTMIIPGDRSGTCPLQWERENAHLAIKKTVKDITANIAFIPECGEGLWYRVVYLNMTDPTQQCPSAWRLYNTSGVRACGRPATSGPSCPATFHSTGRQYDKVCGRIIGYQVASSDAFEISLINPQPSSLDDIYLDGVSITHGNPRSHIWTLAAGVTEGSYSDRPGPDCPCSREQAVQAPNYLRNNYYCESGNRGTNWTPQLYSSDPLWDGQQCEGQCCTNGKSPPWFSVKLPNTTTDDIEVRICGDQGTSDEDTPIQLMEIYININLTNDY